VSVKYGTEGGCRLTEPHRWRCLDVAQENDRRECRLTESLLDRLWTTLIGRAKAVSVPRHGYKVNTILTYPDRHSRTAQERDTISYSDLSSMPSVLVATKSFESYTTTRTLTGLAIQIGYEWPATTRSVALPESVEVGWGLYGRWNPDPSGCQQILCETGHGKKRLRRRPEVVKSS
jgi:hypothetical protein